MKRFFLDHLRKKRGQPPLDSLDDLKDQGFDPAATTDDSERLFDQNVARLFHEQAMQQVREKSEQAGKLPRFDALRRFIHEAEAGAYEPAAEELGLSLANTRVIVHRMREDYFLSFRSLVFQTVQDQKEADTETKYLFELARELPSLPEKNSVTPPAAAR